MTREAFDHIAGEVVLSLRLAEGLSDALLDTLSKVLDEQLPSWRKAHHIDKADAYALILLRDNLIGAIRQYADRDTRGRIEIAARQVEAFTEQALLHDDPEDAARTDPDRLARRGAAP